MKNIDFFYPVTRIQIGNRVFSNGVLFDVYSSKSYFDWCKIRFTEKLLYYLDLHFDKMTPVTIFYGYPTKIGKIFSGYVKRDVNIDKTSENEIVCKDEMVKLETTKMTQTFVDATPQEIISTGLNLAGIDKIQLTTNIYSSRDLTVIREKNIIQVINEVHRMFAIDNKFFFTPDRTFYWGTKPDQEDKYEFIYGENIINLRFEEGFWIIRTIAVPKIQHSNIIKVFHPHFQREYEVFKLHHYTTQKGFPRTEIYFQE
jgi:hypothetical protein